MKKGAKIGFPLLVLAVVVVAGAGFWRGWVQFSVGIDECGVLVSKTGGVYQKPVEKGGFLWRWEPLLPTNARLLTFSMQSCDFRKTVRGSLPSADIYSLQIQQQPDFSYEFDFDIALQLEGDGLVALVESGAVTKAEDVQPYLEQGADRIAALAAQFLLAESAKNPAALLTAFSTEQIVAGMDALGGGEGALAGVAIRSIFVRTARVPDRALYDTARATFDGFQELVNGELAALARKQAEAIVSDNRAVNRLTKIGETLKKYPELSDVLKNSDTAALLKSLDALQ